MRSVNTNKKNENFFSHENNALFNIQISSDGKCYERRYTDSSSYAKMKRNIHTNAQTFENKND